MGTFQEPGAVLVVEDELVIRLYAVTILEDAGYRVLEAKDSAEALAVLAAHDEVRVLLTDVRMPGEMDGLQLVAHVQREYPAIRSIVVSANGAAADALAAGAVRFIPKPYMPPTITGAVEAVMPSHGDRPPVLPAALRL